VPEKRIESDNGAFELSRGYTGEIRDDVQEGRFIIAWEGQAEIRPVLIVQQGLLHKNWAIIS